MQCRRTARKTLNPYTCEVESESRDSLVSSDANQTRSKMCRWYTGSVSSTQYRKAASEMMKKKQLTEMLVVTVTPPSTKLLKKVSCKPAASRGLCIRMDARRWLAPARR